MSNPATAVGLCLGLAYAPHILRLGALIYKRGFWRYDNAYPRDAIAKLEKEDAATTDGKEKPFTNFIKRASAAHQNGLEGFAAFAAAMTLATITKADPQSVGSFANVYLISRVFYNGFYLAGTHQTIAWMRTASWFVGLYCIEQLFLLSASAHNAGASSAQGAPGRL